ncbi:MAG: hypothetical protein HYR96_07085 [Deltaproteobacteria bacterium]|nr:hypothetical protein [Deltaproteobacteria bacterium]MBI3294917.1 hypothetical protein [Deltaproteobacteria bacterium]
MPVSVGLVKEVRGELIARIESVDKKMEAGFKNVESQMQQMLVQTHRTLALMEEQRSENRIVLDGYKSVMERMDRIEDDQKNLRGALRL